MYATKKTSARKPEDDLRNYQHLKSSGQSRGVLLLFCKYCDSKETDCNSSLISSELLRCVERENMSSGLISPFHRS